MRSAIDDFGRAAEIAAASDADDMVRLRDRAFADGMSKLFSICLGDAEVRSAAGWSVFRKQVITLIGASGWALTGYIDDTLDSAPHSALEEWDGWEIACRFRSAVQFLLDEFDDPELLVSPDYEKQMLSEADAELRAQASLVSPLPGERPPAGIPDSHRWWSAASSFAARKIDWAAVATLAWLWEWVSGRTNSSPRMRHTCRRRRSSPSWRRA
ncbi:hypothetical protein [Nocardia sp. NPDC050710]|uniref:hypothetical protein n=1 Tax=Nocardia sp. NPDC050710 TaxID=3157220 RepID=UPI0033FC389B